MRTSLSDLTHLIHPSLAKLQPHQLPFSPSNPLSPSYLQTFIIAPPLGMPSPAICTPAHSHPPDVSFNVSSSERLSEYPLCIELWSLHASYSDLW